MNKVKGLVVAAAVAVALGVSSAPAGAYVHEDAARNFCEAWNEQSAIDNIRYVEDSMGRPHWNIWGRVYYPSQRANAGQINVGLTYHESTGLGLQKLAIDYGCTVIGPDDAHLTMYALAGGNVYWRG